ncbi:MAG: hypothetical protein IPJ81_16060 [Chitinophagaceae bacterium]|nr:hypothetical protein [Chitinophagaceae bacterium]
MNGYCQPILSHIEALTNNNPAKKLSPLGFTQMVMCCMDGSVTPLNDGNQDGHVKDLTVKYRKRPLESDVSDEPSACDTALTKFYNEFTLPSMLYREYALFVPDSLIRQYCKDSSDFIKLNAEGAAEMQEETSVMREVYDMFVEGGGAILKSINKALVTKMSTQFGKNLVSGDNNAVALNFALGENLMQDALIRLMTDWRENELCDNVCMVGNGPFANLDLIKSIFSGNNNQGIDQGKLANMLPSVNFDKDTRTVWGNNQIGVFEKGSLALLTRNKYVGDFARPLGTSNFFSMKLPVNEYNCPQDCLDRMVFDIQVKEIDCPTAMNINGEDVTVGPGVLIVLSKEFNLFVKPSNLYEPTDPLFGTNGTLRYEITTS